MKLLSFGEVLWDIYPDKKYIGGAPLNFAAHFSKLGGESFMLTSVGKDELGKAAIEQLENWNIKTDTINISSKPTGTCIVELDEKSIPTYNLMSDVSWDYIDCDKINSNKFDALYFGTLALRSRHNFNSLNQLIKTNEFEEIFVDINIRPPFYSDEIINFCLQKATIIKISSEELPIVLKALKLQDKTDFKDISQTLSAIFPNLKIIVLTLGADGSYAYYCKDKKEYRCSCKKVQVVSTVGAGDGFFSMFTFSYLNNKNLSVCLENATRLAEYIISKYDAVPDYEPDLNKTS